MAGSYNETIPTDRDWVRMRLNDRGVILDGEGAPVWLRSNEHIDAMLSQYTDRREVAAVIAESLYVELGQKLSSFTDEDGNAVTWRDRAKVYFDIAKVLRSERKAEAEADVESSFAMGVKKVRRLGEHEAGEYVASRSRVVFY